MPLHYTRDDHNERYIVTLAGDVTVDDLARFVAEQLADGFWRFAVLYDGTADGVRLVGLDPPPLDIWRELAREQPPRAPVAFVVADAQQRAIAERYVAEALSEGLFTAAVFREMESAEAWLKTRASPR